MAELPTRGGQVGIPVSPYQVTINGAPGSAGIMTGTGADWFGPLNPLRPIAPPEVAGRQFDFPPGFNLITRPRGYEPIGFAELRAFAQSYDLLRAAIETRKGQIERLQWTINPRDPKLKRKSASVAPDMQKRIDAITAFFRKPDGFNNWKTWIKALLEDMLVIDAPTLYCQRTRDGQLFALEYLDGGTIKRVIDDWGRTPRPYRGPDGAMVYPAAYQAVLKGFPAVDYSVRDIIYRPRNVRTNKVYGFSPVEQVIMTVQIALRRQLWQLEYFTAGSVPDAFIGVPDTWTPDQIKQYQEYLDTLLSGDPAQRRRLRVAPGVKAQVMQTKEPEHKQDFDEWLARIICYALDVSPQWAIKAVGRAEGGQHSENAEQQGLEPTKEWIKGFIDPILEDEFASPDLELSWVEEDETDPQKFETIMEGRLKVAGVTLNQFRDAFGLDPYDDPAADKPMVMTANGFVPIDANTIEGKQANIDAFGPPPANATNPAAAGGNDGAADGTGNPGDAERKSDTAPRSGTDAGKLNGRIPFTKRAAGRSVAPVPFDRPLVRRRVSAIAGTLAAAFSKLQPKVTAAIVDELGKVAKAKKPKARAKSIVDDLDFALIVDAADDIADDLEAVATDTGQLALASLGVDDRSDLVDQVNDGAVAAAKDQAAELVSGIDERTRSMLVDLIAGGLENNAGVDAIADSIEDSGLFSDDRADLIARTEVSRANSQAAVDGYRAARDQAGVNARKEWILGPNPCEICEANADDGAIDLDDDFSSGDDSPPAHPNCECAVSPMVED